VFFPRQFSCFCQGFATRYLYQFPFRIHVRLVYAHFPSFYLRLLRSERFFQAAFFFAAFLFFFAAYLTKETYVLFLPLAFVLGTLWRIGKAKWQVLFFLPFLLLGLAMLSLFNFIRGRC